MQIQKGEHATLYSNPELQVLSSIAWNVGMKFIEIYETASPSRTGSRRPVQRDQLSSAPLQEC